MPPPIIAIEVMLQTCGGLTLGCGTLDFQRSGERLPLVLRLPRCPAGTQGGLMSADGLI